MRFLRAVFLINFFAIRVLAHDGVATPDDWWSHWNTNPLLLANLLLAVSLFLRGAETYPMVNWRKASFIAGIFALLLALISPFDAMSGALFSAHMVQHLLLIIVAAPLFVISRPLAAFLRSLSSSWAKSFGGIIHNPPVRAIWDGISNKTSALGLHLLALWFWHLPFFYELALVNSFVHVLEHASFFLTAMLFWWSVYTAHDYGFRVLSVFLVMMASGLLGALMTFASSPWYLKHSIFTELWGLSPLEDQQLAGLLMWIPPGFVYVLIAALIVATWINDVERKSLEREGRLARELSDG